MNEFISLIIEYLFSWLALDICMWVLGAVGLISIFLFIRYIFSGGFSRW